MDALVIGAAACVWDDFALLEKLYGGLDHFETFAANDGGVLWPHFLHVWGTLHPDELPEREERRRENGYPDGYTTWGITGDVDKVLPHDWQIGGGSSGLLAACVANYLGAERIVLAGVPFDNQGYAVPHMHHGDGPWPYWRSYVEGLPPLARRHPWMMKKICSCSGFTREFFGPPE